MAADYKERPIGIFDSGVGGLTVVSEIIKNLPHENLVYFGDTARVPYGSKSPETITKYSRQIVHFLLNFNVKLIVVACNTVSSNSYEALMAEFDVPMVEVVTPGVSSCLETTKNGRVGVIGTEMTIKSGAYKSKLIEADSSITVYQKACPLFVPLAEEGWADHEITLLAANEYLGALVNQGIDSLILGCTHYPLLEKSIQRAAGNGVSIVNPAQATAIAVKERLKNNHMLVETGIPARNFYVSDNTSKFDQICDIAIGTPYKAEKIDIEKY